MKKANAFFPTIWIAFSFLTCLAGARQTASEPPSGHRLTRFHYHDIALISGIAAVHFFGYQVPSMKNGNWQNRADLKVRHLAQSGMSPRDRSNAKDLSNKLGYFFLTPVVLPPLLLPFDKRNRLKHLDIIAISVRSFAAEKFLGLLVKNLAGRERPRELGCRHDITYSTLCTAEKDRFRSFYSAHTATAFNFSGLLIFQQKYLDPYGLDAWLSNHLGPVWKSLILYSPPLAAAAGVAWLRIKSEEHWFSDVVVGAAIGLGTGFYMPKMLYTGGPASKTGISLQPNGAVFAFHF